MSDEFVDFTPHTSFHNDLMVKGRGKKKKRNPNDPIGSVPSLRSTTIEIQRIRNSFSEETSTSVPMYEALRRIVQFYLDRVGGGAAPGNLEHSRPERRK